MQAQYPRTASIYMYLWLFSGSVVESRMDRGTWMISDGEDYWLEASRGGKLLLAEQMKARYHEGW